MKMIYHLMFALATLALIPTSAPAQASMLSIYYDEGHAAYKAGLYEMAREKLKIVAAHNPTHIPTQKMLADIKRKIGEDNTALRKIYDQVIIEKIEFHDIAMSEAIDAIRIFSRKATNERISPNIILKTPEIGEKKVSINLARVPLSEALNYLASLTGTKLIYEKAAVFYAIP
jgi:hypothetical protein